MSVTTHLTAFGDATVEFTTIITDGDTDLTVNVLPSPTLSLSSPAEVTVNQVMTAEPLGEVIPGELMLAVAPPLTKKRRTLMGVIRAGYMLIFDAGGEAIIYAVDNLAGLNLPPGLGLALGAIGYGLKRAIKPDGLL
jgi:hypothetical protein